MSIEELQARIDKLSTYIDLQKEIIKQLEHSKSAAQRQLNALRDPVAQLPLEISSEVFFQCLPETPTPDARAVQMLLLNVCSTWTDIALSTPGLWATIHMGFPDVQILKTWLRRALNYPLSISFHNAFDDDVSTILGQYAQQLRHLKIGGEKSQIGFGSMPQEFSQLETLTIGNPNANEWKCTDVAQIMELLRRAPNLLECNLHGSFANSDYDAPEKLVLPRLVSLEFGDVEGDSILTHLSLPTLQTFSVPFARIPSDTLILFLKRSSPPLQKLVIGRGDNILGMSFTLAELKAWLELFPSVTRLELYLSCAQQHLIEAFLSSLADSPSHFLPNLRSLKIQYPSPLSTSEYWAVYRVLSRRPAQLACIEINCASSKNGASSRTAQVDRLQQLVADGMNIYIRDPSHNFS
ncbi:hypothetical protein B0H19DRAFT_1201903 [Mycena capillaripes]|nr:hypothetical protein B0H19DRAFT_1201903 [Mycena capillaripes]